MTDPQSPNATPDAPVPVLEIQVPLAEPAPAPLAPPVEPAPLAPPAAAPELPPLELKPNLILLQWLNQLLRRLGATPLSSLSDLLPALRILTLAVVAGIALKLTSATLGAIEDLPLLGGLLELVGLVTLLNFLARNAFKQQKRAELLARIQKLKTDLLG